MGEDEDEEEEQRRRPGEIRFGGMSFALPPPGGHLDGDGGGGDGDDDGDDDDEDVEDWRQEFFLPDSIW